MGVPGHFPILWLSWPPLIRGHQDIFSPYGGTHDEAPKHKDIAQLALFNEEYQDVFQCVGIFIKTIVWNFCEIFL